MYIQPGSLKPGQSFANSTRELSFQSTEVQIPEKSSPAMAAEQTFFPRPIKVEPEDDGYDAAEKGLVRTAEEAAEEEPRPYPPNNKVAAVVAPFPEVRSCEGGMWGCFRRI